MSPANPSPRVRTLIVEDQGMFRAFLVEWFAARPQFEVVGAAASAEEGLRLAEQLAPDLLLADMHLPGMDGLGLVRAVRQTRPEINSLILTSLTDPLAVTRIRESGVEGYLEKDAEPEELAEAVKAVAAGRSYFSPRFRDTFEREGGKPLAAGKILSRRELEVLTHVLRRLANRDIAELMKLSARTVEFHRANVMAKLNATNHAELVESARKHGWSTGA
ncbi:MAG: LuxR family transcriptional regulator [Rariglobus sp.]|jgi:DNA-binding NarL/FixJ family response regulator|nr:LuxR family transcriptional regulator [Rariglobus sp.]